MQSKKHHPIINLTSFLLFFIIIILHYTDIIDISIKNATPLIVIPLLTAFSMFNSTTASAFTGLFVGICMDSASTKALCFNAILLFLCAVFVSVTSNNLFNKNIFSVILLSFITSLAYFLLRWAVFYAFNTNVQDNLIYILKYALPSVLYTNVFVVPFYFLYKRFNKIKSE